MNHVEEKKAPVFLVRDLLHVISTCHGMQYYLRVHYLIHSRNFNPDYATKVNINNFTKMLTGIAYKFSKQKFMTIWMGIGERFWDMVSDNSDITDCSGI